MGDFGNAPVERRSAAFCTVSRMERSVLVADEYAWKTYSILDDINKR